MQQLLAAQHALSREKLLKGAIMVLRKNLTA
jgi:hypothetical protein